MSARLLFVLSLWATAFVGVVHAQERPRCSVVVDPRVAIDVGALGDAIASELDVDVVPDEEEASFRVSLRPRSARQVLVELTHADGRRLRRIAALDPELAERVQTIVIVVANLARDEADELLAALRRRRETSEPEAEPPPDAIETPIETIEIEPVAEPSEQAPEAPTTIEPPDAVEVEDDAPIEDETPVEDETPIEDDAPPHDPYVRLGLDGQLGSVPGPGGALAVAWLAGLEIAWTPLPFFALALRDLGGGYSLTERWHLGGALVGEAAWRFADWGDLHGQLGVHVQYISPATTRGADTVGVAPVLVLGARWFATSFFSLSLETAIRVVASEAFHMGIELVPQGAVVWTGGLALAFHVP